MHVRLERSEGILETFDEETAVQLTQWVNLGPAEWFQLTYAELRVAPDGDVIAYYDTEDPGWRLVDNSLVRLHTSPLDRAHPFSDVVIY